MAHVRIKNISDDILTLPLPLKGSLAQGGSGVTSLPIAKLYDMFNDNPFGATVVELTEVPDSVPVTVGIEGPFDFGGYQIKNLGVPTDPTDAATKAYVDTSGGGGGGGITELTGDVNAGPAAGSTTSTVVALQGNAVSTSAPAASDVLTWDGTAWIPQAPAPGGITELGGDVIAGPGTGFQNATVAGIEGVPVDATAPTAGQVLGYDGTWWTPTTLTDTGITELTGDVTAGPGSGSQAATVTALQGNAVSSLTPSDGQVLTWNGSAWVPGAQAAGGSGGGGQTYFFNNGVAPTGTAPAGASQLGLIANVALSSVTSLTLPNDGITYAVVAGFVTDVNVPGLTYIPAGVWDFNIWADAAGPSLNPNDVHMRARVYKWNGATSTLLSTGSVAALYDPSQNIQYISSALMPQTVLLNTDRIYVTLEATSTANSHTIKFYFGDSVPSHVHTTLPSVAGTGLVHVINGVIQSPASPVDLTAGATEISGTLPIGNGGTGLATTPTDGQLLIGTTATNDYTLATLTAGTNVSITNGAGSVTIDAVGSIAGTIAANEIAFGTNVDTVGGDARLTWNPTTPVLAVDVPVGTPAFVVQDTGVSVYAKVEPGAFRQESGLDKATLSAVGSVELRLDADTAGAGYIPTISAYDETSTPHKLDLVLGELRVNGAPGAAGEVLTSNGPNFAPTWTTPAAGTVTSVGATAPITSTGGTTPTIGIAAATTLAAGSMSASDKLKLDGITAGAAVASVGTTSPLTNTGTATAPVVALTSGGSAGNVLTWNGSAWAGAAPAAAGITALTGDVTASGSGSVAATVAKLQGYDVATTAPTSNQILQWIAGTSKWTPTANGVGLGGRVHLVVEGGAYASLQAAVTAASANDVILVGPTGTVSSGSWGDVTFPAQKRLSVIGLNGARGTSVRIGKVTFAPTTGLNINENEVFLRGLFINADFSGSQGVFFGGTALARLRLADCFIFNSGASGNGIVANNTAAPSGGASSSLYIDGCLVQTATTSGAMFKNVTGYTIIRNGSSFEGGQYALQAQAGLVECFNSFFEMNAPTETIRVESAQVTMTWCRVTNSNASGVGVNITTTYASTQALFGMNNGTFLVGGASPMTPYCVKGVAGPGGLVPGSLYAYGQVTYGASSRCQNTLIFTQSPQTHTSVA